MSPPNEAQVEIGGRMAVKHRAERDETDGYPSNTAQAGLGGRMTVERRARRE